MPKKNVLIATLCRSPNVGAYLQAYALQEVLKKKGLNPCFLDIYDWVNNLKRYKFIFRRRGKLLINLPFNFKQVLAFKLSEKQLNIIKKDSNINFDGAFVGSDEIWNVTNSTFNTVPEFFGINIPTTKKFTYAPSVGNATHLDIRKYPVYVNGINSFDLLSVRDSETFTTVSELAPNKMVTRVVDPTFLYDFSDDEEPITIPVPYIAVYTYGMKPEKVSEVRDYARKNNLMLVSPTIKHMWCDMNIPSTPFQFLSIIKNAKCVITDTFHGSIFAIKYKKDFISYGDEKKKVKDLLMSLKLNSSLIADGELSKISKIETDYKDVAPILNEKILVSHQYLAECMQRIGC